MPKARACHGFSKAVIAAAVPRKVRAACSTSVGVPYYFVRGDNGKPEGPIFRTQSAFTRYIKQHYPLR